MKGNRMCEPTVISQPAQPEISTAEQRTELTKQERLLKVLELELGHFREGAKELESAIAYLKEHPDVCDHLPVLYGVQMAGRICSIG